MYCVYIFLFGIFFHYQHTISFLFYFLILHQIPISHMQSSKMTSSRILQFISNIKANPLIHLPIKALILESKEVCYVTDGHIIFQVSFPHIDNRNSSRDQLPNPFNKIRGNYYNFCSKSSRLFLYNQSDIQYGTNLGSEYSPYHPQFHFQEQIQDFDPNVALEEIRSLTDILIIKVWDCKIVNISNTGYFGVIIQVYQYEKYSQKIPIPICSQIHSILYEKLIAQRLDQMRLSQIKKSLAPPDLTNYISLFYYMKNLKVPSINKCILSNFVSADKDGRFLKTSPSIVQSFIPLGKMNGVLRLIRPITNYVNFKKPQINFHKFKDFSSCMKKNLQNVNFFTEGGENSENSENSGSDQEEANQGSAQSSQTSLSEGQSSQDSQFQDPLKLIYLKQLQKMKII